jgi:hypothetical protein
MWHFDTRSNTTELMFNTVAGASWYSDGLDGQCSNPSKGRRVLSTPQLPDQLWGPPSLAVKLTTHVQLVLRSTIVELYLHSPMSLWCGGNWLNTGTTMASVPFTAAGACNYSWQAHNIHAHCTGWYWWQTVMCKSCVSVNYDNQNVHCELTQCVFLLPDWQNDLQQALR